MNNKGFTLIEIMLVVVIIGILAAIVVPNFVGQSNVARVNAAKGEMASIATALGLFEINKGRFPDSLNELVGIKGGLKNMPLDPWGSPYVYQSGGDTYELYSQGDGTPIYPGNEKVATE